MQIKRYKDMTKWERKEMMWIIVAVLAYAGIIVEAAILSQVN